MKEPYLEQSAERATVMKSGWWICGVTEGYVLYGKAFTAMRVFPQTLDSSMLSFYSYF
jgi:hypothetical protein